MNYAVLTIDVEAPKGEGYDSNSPIRSFIWGERDKDHKFGVDLIMDMLDELGIVGLFFVDLAEATDYGMEEISNVILHIIERGHEVGVHLHPNHMADEKRFFLYEYTRKEQYNMISACKDLYQHIVGFAPKYFRAGKYSANRDTLDILNDLGFLYDFSEFFGSTWCGIHPPLTASRPCSYGNLIEIPVTTFFSIDFFGYKRIDKIDLEMSKKIHNYVIDMIDKKSQSNIVTLFLHSFSFMDWRRFPNKPTLIEEKLQKVKSEINHVYTKRNIQFIKPVDLDGVFRSGEVELKSNDSCEIHVKNPLISYLYIVSTSLRIFKINNKAKVFIIVNNLIVLFLLMVFCYFIFRN